MTNPTCVAQKKPAETTADNIDRTYCIRVDRTRAQINESAVFEVFERVLNLYKPNEILLSFNGGKDCTVLLHMLAKFYAQKAVSHVLMPVLYIQTEDSFKEIDEFVVECTKRYHVILLKRCGKIKQVLEELCKEMTEVKAVFMGSRRTDPYCEKLTVMQATDPDWPPLMRINPILDWNCRDIWDYIFAFQVPYCSLYDQGYTSLGSVTNTRPNPHLRRIDKDTGKEYYLPAYEIADDDLVERAGRT